MGIKKPGSTSKPKHTARSKRPLILDAALKLFLAHGFSQTTMADIALEASVSTATLYKHFRSKEEVFSIIIDTAMDKFKTEFITIDTNQSATDLLIALMHMYMRHQYHGGVNALMRTVIAESTSNPVVVKRFHEAILRRRDHMVTYLDLLVSQGKLDIDDTKTAALVLVGSVKELLAWPALFNPMHTPPDNASKSIRQIIETFVSIWTPK